VLVALLAYVLFMVGLSLSGMFEISGRFMGVGSTLAARRSGALGSFFTGTLAAIVATPCTAPFMATALGVALTQSATIAMATFLMLGFGLALPYLALSLFPSFARVLPRPGGWMNTLKQILAFPLYASAAWLVWVLDQQAGADSVFAVLLGMVAIAFAIWLWRLQSGGGPARTLRATVCSAVLFGGVILAVTVVHQKATSAGTLTANALSEPFSRVELDRLRARGKPVFINLTAAWCITCQVNERVALSGEEFRAALKAGGFVYLKGDWTRQNPEITQFLESFGRAGVPLYVVFPPNGRQAVVLPQVLTESIVVGALRVSTPTSIAMSGDSICDSGLWQRAERCSYLQ
jgi:thiol:disulfide interchange protein DsbD